MLSYESRRRVSEKGNRRRRSGRGGWPSDGTGDVDASSFVWRNIEWTHEKGFIGRKQQDRKSRLMEGHVCVA